MTVTVMTITTTTVVLTESADDDNDHDFVDECSPLASFTLTDQMQLDALALTSAEGQPQCCFLSTH